MDRFLTGVERRALVLARVATSNSDDALDLVQEAMFKLAQKYMDKDESEWGALFHRILQSKIRDWYRRNKTRSRWLGWLKPAGDDSDADPIQHAPDSGEQNPETRLMGKRTLSKLSQAVHSLPLRQQQAFMLRVWEGFDVSETARAMGCSNGSVKTHLSRALERLRNNIENELEPHAEP